MSVKDFTKAIIQKGVLTGPVYSILRDGALRATPLKITYPQEILEDASPRPPAMRAQPAAMLSPAVDLSVIVPVYNVERYVGECLSSILRQNVDATMEVIVVVDGATDGSLSVVQQIAQHDERVVVIEQKNKGLSAARNTGLDCARGRMVAFVDSDDCLDPGHLQALVSKLKAESCDFVSGRYTRLSDDGRPLGIEEVVRENMAPWGRVFYRHVWEQVRFPEGAWYEDLVMPCCVWPLFSECLSEDAGYLYRIRPGSIVESTPHDSKGLDSYWVLEEMVGWKEHLGIRYSGQDYDRILPLFGPLLMGRTTFLSPLQRRALFSACCDLFGSIEEFSTLRTHLGPSWSDLEKSLRVRSYGLWCLSCAALAAPTRSIKLAIAWSFFLESLRG